MKAETACFWVRVINVLSGCVVVGLAVACVVMLVFTGIEDPFGLLAVVGAAAIFGLSVFGLGAGYDALKRRCEKGDPES